MKKSRIIIPALALIALSTVASVTGTVAWFTASRSVTVTASEFAVTKTSSNLTVTLGNGEYTTANTNTKSVSVNSKTILTHGSFDHVNKNFYVPNSTASSVTEVSINDEALTTKLVQSTDSDSNKIVTAVTWSMSLSVTFSQSGRDMALFFDKAGSSAYKSGTNNVLPTKTGLGFRVAFVAGTPTISAGTTTSSEVTKVWAPNRNATGCKYVNGTGEGAMDGTTYTSGLIASDTTVTIPEDEKANAAAVASNPGYLGTFVFDANKTVNLNYTVVAWFEGTDEEIKASADTMETLTASMKFEARTIAPTTQG